MFTGIIEKIGTVVEKSHSRITIETEWKDLKVGESISASGVCLTVAGSENFGPLGRFTADLSRETLESTTLGSVNIGSRVNLERALKLGERLGGHFLSGHVDGRGKVKAIAREKEGKLFQITTSPEILKYIVSKGSIGVDGISLTVVKVINGTSFSVSIIPHTEKVTTFGLLKVNDSVNIEVDMLARYVENLINKKKEKSGITKEFLLEKGFL
ncbi:riboflavin synthase [bacterium]|nr:riboflavin synthase [bacterium]NIN92151.1 riboflavin synthase [bacterium]NIO18809.1 riboflavin synthase [bacterium]NIO73893.1 riboflavin synthase [bacterium]